MEWFGACSRAEPISSQAAVFSTGVPLEVCVYEGFFLFSFFQCWLILNLSSLVDFKIKYRTIRDLLSHCLRVSNKNSPFVAVSVLGHFYNLFSSSVSKLTRLSCFHHSCLGGCSRSLLLWGSQAFCNKNVSPVLNSLIASLYMFVLVPQLCFQLKSFSLPMPQLYLFLQDTPITLLITGGLLCARRAGLCP